jgi:hypothetical protein
MQQYMNVLPASEAQRANDQARAEGVFGALAAVEGMRAGLGLGLDVGSKAWGNKQEHSAQGAHQGVKADGVKADDDDEARWWQALLRLQLIRALLLLASDVSQNAGATSAAAAGISSAASLVDEAAWLIASALTEQQHHPTDAAGAQVIASVGAILCSPLNMPSMPSSGSVPALLRARLSAVGSDISPAGATSTCADGLALVDTLLSSSRWPEEPRLLSGGFSLPFRLSPSSPSFPSPSSLVEPASAPAFALPTSFGIPSDYRWSSSDQLHAWSAAAFLQTLKTMSEYESIRAELRDAEDAAADDDRSAASATQVPRRSLASLSVGEFREQYAAAGRPVVITGVRALRFDNQEDATSQEGSSKIVAKLRRHCASDGESAMLFHSPTTVVSALDGDSGDDAVAEASTAWAGLEEANRENVNAYFDRFEAHRTAWLDSNNSSANTAAAASSSSSSSSSDASSPPYLFDWSIPKNCPSLPLSGELRIPAYFGARDLLQHADAAGNVGSQSCGYQDSWPSLLVGPAGSGAGVHIDSFGSNFWMVSNKCECNRCMSK